MFYKETSFKDTSIGEIPKDWEVKELNDIGTFQYGYTTSAKNEDTGIKFLRITDIKENGTVDWDQVPFCSIGEKDYDKYELKEGDILFARIGATAGKTSYMNLKVSGIFASYLIRFQTKKELNSKYVFYFTQSRVYWSQAFRRREGQLKKGLNANTLSRLKIAIPHTYTEQQKIAEILSSVDDALSETREVITKTERLKQGLMQELLTKGIGHKEFKRSNELGCEIPKDWDVVELGEITEEIYRYPTYYNIEYCEKGVPEIRGELVKDDGELETDLSKYRFISEETSKRFPRTILKEGDFVLSVRGTMGKVAIVPKFLHGANMTANLMKLSLSCSRCYPLFFKQVFLSKLFQNKLSNVSSYTTIKTIQAPKLKSIKIPLPPLAEQQKIAEFLSSIDEKLEIERSEKERLERVKQGLMDILLTGKVRAKV